jgi:hypothetical protein
MVNWKVVNIFNRVFEVQESAQNAENFAKMCAFETGESEFTMPALTMAGAYGKGTIC